MQLESLDQQNRSQLDQKVYQKKSLIEIETNSKKEDIIVVEEVDRFATPPSDLSIAMDKLDINEERVLERLKEGIDSAIVVDKNGNPIADWKARSQMLNMVAKMKGMFKEENIQNQAIVNIFNAFSKPNNIY